MTDKAMAFSQLGDRLFDRFASRISQDRKWRLLCGQRLDQQRFEQIRVATAHYVSACLGLKAPVLSERKLMDLLVSDREKLVNYTSGALLMPKREHTLEFNALQRAVSASVADLGVGDLIETIDLPVNLRMVYGQADAKRTNQPYASSKLHSDVWAGVPVESVVVVLPIFGDIENITIEFGELHREQELPLMRKFGSYDEPRDVRIAVACDDVKMQHGVMGFCDARTLHKTVRRSNQGVRLSVDFRFQLKGAADYKALAAGASAAGEESSVSFPEWCDVGNRSVMVFDETVEEARSNERSTTSAPIYARDFKLVDLHQAREVKPGRRD